MAGIILDFADTDAWRSLIGPRRDDDIRSGVSVASNDDSDWPTARRSATSANFRRTFRTR